MSVICPGIINSSFENVNLTPFRIILLTDCRLFSKFLINSVIKAIKRPHIIFYQDTYGAYKDGNWTGAYGELVGNRSDLFGDLNLLTLDKYHAMTASPAVGHYGSIAIMSANIPVNIIHGSNSLFTGITLKVWLLFITSLVVVAIFDQVCSLTDKILI